MIRLIAALSLTLNVSMAAILAFVFGSQDRSAHLVQEANIKKPLEISRKKSSSSPASTALTPAPKQWDWRSLESPDYKEYIEKLRAIGCPEQTIEDIIVADVNALFADRAREGARIVNYWDSKTMLGFDPEQLEKGLALETEKREFLRELLGRDPLEKTSMNSFFGTGFLEKTYGFLPVEKQIALLEIDSELNVKYLNKQGSYDGEAFSKREKEKNERLKQLLTPEEFRDYELRISPLSMQLRMDLSTFRPSQEEFDKIFDLRKTHQEKNGEQSGALVVGIPADPQSTQAKAELGKQIKELLGPERYQEYERGQDYSYRSLVRLTEKNGLPPQAAGDVYQVRELYQREQTKLLTDANLAPERRQEALTKMKSETEAEVRKILGEKGFTSFKKNMQASIWLQQPQPIPNVQK